MSIRQTIAGGFRRASGWLGSLAERTAAPIEASRGWKAGEFNRAAMDFQGSTLGINAMADMDLKRVWARSRELCEQDPAVKAARDASRRNIVGDQGIYYEPNTGNGELDKILRDWFWRRAERVDKDRMRSLAMMQGEWYMDYWALGECLAYFPVVGAWRGYDAGPCIELIDSADRVDVGFSEGRYGDAARIRQGVEFDKDGRVVAYHVYRDSPSDGGWFVPTSTSRDRISAMDAHLGLMRIRRNQIRGVPVPVAIVMTSRLVDDFTNAAILLEQARASIGIVFEGVTAPQVKAGERAPAVFGVDGQPIKTLRPGNIMCVPTGVKANAVMPTMNGQNLQTVDEVLKRRMAAACGMGYETFTGDRTRSTFSAGRTAALEERKYWREQQGWLIHEQLTRPWWEREVMFGILSGGIKLSNELRDYANADKHRLLNVSVVGPGWEWVNPAQEAAATQIAMDLGVLSFQDACAERGKFWQDEITKSITREKFETEARTAAGLGPKASPAPMNLTIVDGQPGQPQDGQPSDGSPSDAPPSDGKPGPKAPDKPGKNDVAKPAGREVAA